MTRTNHRQLPNQGHVLVPAAAIGGLSVLLAAGLSVLGLLDRIDGVIATTVSRGGRESFPKHLPDPLIWLSTAILAFGLAFAMLSTDGILRRLSLWITSAVLVATWAPVLSLAAHSPAIAAPWIATVWSGVCTLVYTAKHRSGPDTDS